jgi:hypothetical protein
MAALKGLNSIAGGIAAGRKSVHIQTLKGSYPRLIVRRFQGRLFRANLLSVSDAHIY